MIIIIIVVVVVVIVVVVVAWDCTLWYSVNIVYGTLTRYAVSIRRKRIRHPYNGTGYTSLNELCE